MPTREEERAANSQELQGYQKEVFRLKTKVATVESERDQIKADYNKLREGVSEIYKEHHKIEIITMHGF